MSGGHTDDRSPEAAPVLDKKAHASRHFQASTAASFEPSVRPRNYHPTKEEFVTAHMDQAAAPLTPAPDSEFDLDITLLEVADPGHLINMTDDGCGTTCEKSTCITNA